ncbi:hypothetical protein POUND7_016519 [Theobroma cacao]
MTFIGLKKGDIIPIPLGSVSWWYNHGRSDLVMLFLGEASKACLPGKISYFLLIGAIGHLSAFSPELSQEEAKIIPELNQDSFNTWTKNLENASPDVDVKKGGKSTTLTGVDFPLLEEVELSANLLVLKANATCSPMYAADAQITGLNGKLVLDTKVKTGQLFVVPRFFMVSLLADREGMECFSIMTSALPVIGELAGKDSVLNTIPSALQVCLNVTPKFTQEFKGIMETGTIIVPPMFGASI